MKREKGSALMTVILIVAVTATIGAAISSFILMNYRLRAYDNQIRRAEYKAEEVIDTTHLYLLSKFGATDGILKNLQEDIENKAIEDETTVIVEQQDGTYYEFDGTKAVPKSDIETIKDTRFKEAFSSLDIKSIIEDIIDNDSNSKTKYAESVSGVDTTDEESMYVVVDDNPTITDNRIVQKVYVYYVIPKNAVIRGNPIARFSVEYVITCPDYSMVYPTVTYNITNYIGITNWTIENNWRL